MVTNSNKWKYRLTPLHLVALYFLYETIRYSRIVIKDGDKVELGALFPFIYFSLFLLTLASDLLIQFIVTGYSRAGWKILYLIQMLLILLIAIYLNETVHYG